MSFHPLQQERDPVDFYPTPERCVKALVSLLQIEPHHAVLEPSAGSGNFVRELRRVTNTLHAVEAYPRDEGVYSTCDRFTRTAFERHYPEERYDWIVGNPPFSLAKEHVQQGLFLLKPGGRLAFLLRAGFAHTQGRWKLFNQFPPWREYALETRPDFMGNGKSDGAEYVFYVWERGYTGRTIREYVSWDDDERRPIDLKRVRERDWTGVRGTLQLPHLEK